MTGGGSEKSWFTRPRANPGADVRLFCFPYAGGGAAFFREWGRELPSFVEVCLAQLPGRGARLAEPPFTKLTDMVEALAEAISPYLDKPFAFFGHSMGGMISFELARAIRKERQLEPVHLFISGLRAPQDMDASRATYNLPEQEFIEELRRLNGTPREILEHPELMQLIGPILRADFSVCETHRYERAPPLRCPFTIFGGLNDVTEGVNLENWREHTTSSTVRIFPGDHFFIHAAQSEILRIIGDELLQAVKCRV